MGEKFFIKTMNLGVDLDKLIERIEYRMALTGTGDLYIFMNIETFRAMTEEVFKVYHRPSDVLQMLKVRRSPIGEFYGCKIFEDNTLVFGAIEIR